VQATCKLKMVKCSSNVIKLDNSQTVWGWKKTRFFFVKTCQPSIMESINIINVCFSNSKFVDKLDFDFVCHLPIFITSLHLSHNVRYFYPNVHVYNMHIVKILNIFYFMVLHLLLFQFSLILLKFLYNVR